MKKYQLLLLLALNIIHISNGQHSIQKIKTSVNIDSIKTTQEIKNLIFEIDNQYIDFKVSDTIKFSEDYYFDNKKCQKYCESLKPKSYSKADFDNNGQTDLLVVGKWNGGHSVLCILNLEKNKYEIIQITRRSFEDCTFPIVDNNKINYYHETYRNRYNKNDSIKLERKVLLYQFGDFIEENINPTKHNIEKIEYRTSQCFGACPAFSLEINADKTASWSAARFNRIDKKELEGTFNTTISQDKFDDLVNLLNYIDFEKLKDKYAVNWTDDQTCYLKITYDNGKTKSIQDYGLLGTYGLDRIYQLLFELRENQKWVKE